jgi:hypothetical protein
MSYKFHKKINGIDFYAPSTRENKKYDAIVNNKKYSFGDTRYEQYHDKIGYYHSKNNEDEQRRTNYRTRHKNDKIHSYSNGFFSWHYLW